jgi:hypothetical protein
LYFLAPTDDKQSGERATLELARGAKEEEELKKYQKAPARRCGLTH